MSLPAAAQESREPEGGELPAYAQVLRGKDRRGARAVVNVVQNGLPNIMVTGYWPPTNEMLRQFSTNPDQNPGGWVGENWEGRGYNIYSFFPEFPQGLGQGEGDFEVDYQDTSYDWWLITAQVQPFAIITFSRAANNWDWEMEGGNKTYSSTLWTEDYLDPRQPTPDLPIYDEPAGTERYSSLPMQAIVDAVAASGANVYPYIEPLDYSRFLSNFIGYHGNWYHDLHSDPDDPAWNVAGGHIHVGYAMTLADAILASEVTLRTLIVHADAQLGVFGDLNCDGLVDLADIDPFIQALSDPDGYVLGYPDCRIILADLNRNGSIDGADLQSFVDLLLYVPPDESPPEPDPLTWEVPPTPVSTSELTMTATEAVDDTPPVEYFFFYWGDGGPDGNSSGWQEPNSYNDDGLLANTVHTYSVRARDSAEPPHSGDYSAGASAATAIETPTGLAAGTITMDSIEVTAGGTFTNLALAQSGLYFEWEETTSGTPVGNSGWVQTTTVTASALSPGTEYTFRVKARNQDGAETDAVEDSFSTLPAS
jgi:hypothetical protein